MKKIIYLMFAVLGLSSCSDWFTLTPESEMVKEDFWKSKNDVLSSIGACYRAMDEEGFVKHLIAWGELRSDNILPGKSSDSDVNFLLEANITSANYYARWGEQYAVINLANTVIENAPSVRDVDPDFSEAELRQYIAEATAIRAFCYFNLVRTFRDVPYITEPYYDDSRSFMMPQTAGDDILRSLLADLQAVKDDATQTYPSVAYQHGRITRRAVIALMADIHLWLGNYQQCADLCNEVLADAGQMQLDRSTFYFDNLYFRGNSEESIWELQYDQNTQNYATRDLFGGSSNDPKVSSYDFSPTGQAGLFANVGDLRAKNSFVGSDGFYFIKKYVARLANPAATTIRNSDFAFGNATNNWIVYRLADIILMRAEALAEIGGQENLDEAVRLVSRTYDRANPSLPEGSLIGQFASQEQVRNLVLDERQREFLYEGKRYFDLMRRMRRDGSPTEVINSYLITKYIAQNLDRSTVMSKLNDVDAIYMPIHDDELRANLLLEQNRFYKTSSDIIKK